VQVSNLVTRNAAGSYGQKADINNNRGRARSGATWVGDRFIGLSGTSPAPAKSNVLFYLSIGSLGSARDFGDLTALTGDTHGTMSSGTRGVAGGGNPGSFPYGTTDMQYFSILSRGNAVDSNELNTSRHGIAGSSNGHRGMCSAGGLPPASVDTLDMINLVTVQDAIDYGEFGFVVNHPAGCSNGARSLNGGGWVGSVSDGLRVFSFTTHTGTATDYGELGQARSSPRSTDDGSRGVFAGGTTHPGPRVDKIDYMSIATNGSAADFGEMFTAGGGMATTSDGSRGMMCGGEDLTGSSHYLNIGTLGKSIEFGDLDASITAPAGPGGAVSGG
jgi:hypothetical protein